MEYRHHPVVSQTGPDFAASLAPNGYAWWYLDALSDCGQYGLTVIDAERDIRTQQLEVRKLIKRKINLSNYKLPYVPRLPEHMIYENNDDNDADL